MFSVGSPIHFSGLLTTCQGACLELQRVRIVVTQTMTRKAERKKKEEPREERTTQGYTAGYWQNQEKNLRELRAVC